MGWPYQQKPPMGWPLDYDSGVMPDAGFWPMLEGSGNKVFDLSGNGYTGTLGTNSIWVGNYISIAGGLPASIAAGICSDTASSTFILYYYIDSSIATQRGYYLANIVWFRDMGSGVIRLYRIYGTGNWANVDTPALATGWHQLALTHDQSVITGYVDGISIGSAGAVGTGDTSASAMDVGGGTQITKCKYGSIYNRALSASEIALLYRYPFWMFKDPAEVALLGGYQAAPTGIPIFRRRRAG